MRRSSYNNCCNYIDNGNVNGKAFIGNNGKADDNGRNIIDTGKADDNGKASIVNGEADNSGNNDGKADNDSFF